MTDQASGPPSGPALEAFSRASSVRPRADGTFDAEVSAEWTIAGKPNGGYLVALLGRVASTLTDSGRVIAASARHLRAPDPGPVEIHGKVLRRGRTASHVRARLSQGETSCVEALLSTSELDTSAAPRWDAGVLDGEHASFEDCIRLEPTTPDGQRAPMLDQVDMRLDPESSGMTRGRPSGRGQLCGWLKLLGEAGFDPISLLYAVDAFPPATWDTAFSTWVSTIELTTYVRAVPAPGPVRIIRRARLIDLQWVDETCDVWDVTGRLVAQATQLAKVLG